MCFMLPNHFHIETVKAVTVATVVRKRSEFTTNRAMEQRHHLMVNIAQSNTLEPLTSDPISSLPSSPFIEGQTIKAAFLLSSFRTFFSRVCIEAENRTR